MSKETIRGKFSELEADHTELINSLDEEAYATIDAIKEAHKNDEELTDFIPMLQKDWFTIEWNEYNRKLRPQPQPKQEAYKPHTYTQPSYT